ncbi:MAG: phosphate ABC transporter permease subunit PstC [Rhodospirillaceae bacterium]|jgi:phosphate transport system permease protein|nr:phosphate ABC transporter permease subunit PstC [Rhodospirillaceae bacterium]
MSLLIAGLLTVVLLSGFYMARGRALASVSGHARQLHSRPSFYGTYVALWCALPALLIWALWSALDGTILRTMVMSELPQDVLSQGPEIIDLYMRNVISLATGGIASADSPELRELAAHYGRLQSIANWSLFVIVLGLASGGLLYSIRRIRPDLRARVKVERTVDWILIIASTVSILTTIGIVLSLLFEAMRFFDRYPVLDFLFGLDWSPQTAIREDQVGQSGAFGMIPVLAGTMLVTVIAMCVAVPIGLLSAIYMSEYAGPKTRTVFKPVIEILAGIPTVVYGFFAALSVAPVVRQIGQSIGLDVASESALAAGLVMGIMIIPFVSSLSDDVINSVPQSLREGSYGLGATKAETIRQVILPAALPGIVSAVLLAVSRAVGETMIVVMAAGLAANLTANPFEAVTTVTVQIVTLLVGDQEFDSAKTLSAFALGLVLFAATLALNVVALYVVKKYREAYD